MRTNRLVSTAALSVLVLAPVAVAQAGQRAVVEGMSQKLTVACGNEGAHVQGAGNTVTLTGTCTSVHVEGQNNTVHIATLGSLKVEGMGNKVFWANGIDGATPKITKEGMGNSVEHKAPAASPAPAATASAAKPAASVQFHRAAMGKRHGVAGCAVDDRVQGRQDRRHGRDRGRRLDDRQAR